MIQYRSTLIAQSSAHGLTWLLELWMEHTSTAALQPKTDMQQEIAKAVYLKTA